MLEKFCSEEKLFEGERSITPGPGRRMVSNEPAFSLQITHFAAHYLHYGLLPAKARCFNDCVRTVPMLCLSAPAHPGKAAGQQFKIGSYRSARPQKQDNQAVFHPAGISGGPLSNGLVIGFSGAVCNQCALINTPNTLKDLS